MPSRRHPRRCNHNLWKHLARTASTRTRYNIPVSDLMLACLCELYNEMFNTRYEQRLAYPLPPIGSSTTSALVKRGLIVLVESALREASGLPPEPQWEITPCGEKVVEFHAEDETVIEPPRRGRGRGNRRAA